MRLFVRFRRDGVRGWGGLIISILASAKWRKASITRVVWRAVCRMRAHIYAAAAQRGLTPFCLGGGVKPRERKTHTHAQCSGLVLGHEYYQTVYKIQFVFVCGGGGVRMRCVLLRRRRAHNLIYSARERSRSQILPDT